MTPDARIGPIAGVTVATPDLAASEDAYVRYLAYHVGTRGTVSPEQARAWERPGAAGARYVTVHPAAGDDFAFRFIEAPPAHNYRAFSSFGWNAAELIVRDVDSMVSELAGSPFEMLGPPQDLSFTDAIRAMQVRGPAGEILYLTQFKRDLESLPAPPARCKVDRVFIVIVAGPSLDHLLTFYTTRFAVPTPQRMQSRVKAMSAALGLPVDHRYDIAALPLQGGCYIEADQMPATAKAPVTATGHLPPGIAIVSFKAPYQPKMQCLTGPAGEIIEINGS